MLVWPVVCTTTDCRWVIQTPDGDLYVEPLGTSATDGPERVLPLGGTRRLPALQGERAYRFPAWPSDTELRGVLREGFMEARRVWDTEGLPPIVPPMVINKLRREIVLTVFCPGGPWESVPVRALPTTRSVPEGVWVSSENILDRSGALMFKVGDIVSLTERDLHGAAKGIHFTVSGIEVAVERLDPPDLERYKRERSRYVADVSSVRSGLDLEFLVVKEETSPAPQTEIAEDLRTLAVRFDEHGDRHRVFREA
eukprot:6491429-Amphidinium_carterae.5